MSIRKTGSKSHDWDAMSDHERKDLVYTSDMILALDRAKHKGWILYSRPIAEMKALGGPPYKFFPVTLEITNKAQLRAIHELVKSMKAGAAGVSQTLAEAEAPWTDAWLE